MFKLLNHRFIMWRNVGGEKVCADAQIIFKKKGKNGIEKIFWNRKKILIFSRNGALSIIYMYSIIKILKL